jgi:signal transduction histidine kinase/CheY-like chemotaxis protein/HPt (histidine-containing phosphotransfer) domain-containing protein
MTYQQTLSKAWSLRTVLVCSLLVFAVVPALVVGWVLYRSNQQSVDDLSQKIVRNVALRVQLDTENHLMQVHSLLNGLLPAQHTAAQLAEAKQLMADPADFERVAFQFSRMSPNVSFVYLGTRQGEFYGVQKQLDDAQQRATIHLRATGQAGRRYFLAEQAGNRQLELPAETKDYEPRERPWYSAAVKKKSRVFSPVYTSASSGQLLITLAQPVVDTSGSVMGVFAADLFLKRLDELLQSQSISPNGVAMLLDEQGYLLATSVGAPLFSYVRGELIRNRPGESAHPLIARSIQAVSQTMVPLSDIPTQQTQLDRLVKLPDGESLLTVMRPFGDTLGLNWTLIVAAPESDFSAERRSAILRSLYAMLAILLVGATISALLAYRISHRFGQLKQAALQLGRGQVPPLDLHSSIAEVRVLSGALHYSAQEIKQSRSAIETQAHALHEANIHLEQRVKARTGELEASRQEALAAARAKSAFLATMSHEIRTPLSGVVGMATLMADTPLNAEQSDYLHTMRVSSDQLLGVINDILDFSKVESGKLELEDEPMSVRATVEEACEIAAERAREKGLGLLVDISDDTPEWVRGDVTRLRQILLNYINNAIKFTHEGQVIVSVSLVQVTPENFSVPQRVVLNFRVKDTGIGIPLDRQHALFESFSQVDSSTTRRYGGTGLGLAICKRLAGLMAGEVGVESSEGVGSAFWFTAQLALASPPAPSSSLLFGMASLVGKTAVVVDDTPLHLRILDKQLRRWGMHAKLFSHAALALKWLRDNPADVVITDMHMPEIDGMSFALDARKIRPHAHLVLLTSGNMPDRQANQVFNACLLKPYRQAQLFDALTLAVAPPAEPAAVSVVVRKNQVILVADDNTVNLKIARFMLTKLGYEIAIAHNGREAVNKVSEGLLPGGRPFAAVLMDVNMPVLDGIRATEQINRMHGPLAPPIWALTASVLLEDRQRYMAAGMRGPLSKPMHIDELAQALAQVAHKDGGVSLGAELVRSSDTILSADTAAYVDPANTLVDWTRLAQFADFDDDGGSLVRNVVTLFVAELPARIKALRSSAEAQNIEALSLAAHALKGAASNVGASAIGQACFVLEQSCKDGNWPPDIEQQLVKIEALGPQTQHAFGNWALAV